MRRFLTLLAPVFFACTLHLTAGPAPATGPAAHALASPAVTEMPTLRGRVIGPNGPLVGAVVQVVGTSLMTVTNANGEFNLTLPKKDATPLRLMASYAGFNDETLTLSPSEKNVVLELATPQDIKVAHNQQLKNYLRTAHRQARRSLRSVR